MDATKSLWLSPDRRPTSTEVDAYARLIMAHEGAPAALIDRYRREAELQIWAARSLGRTRVAKPDAGSLPRVMRSRRLERVIERFNDRARRRSGVPPSTDAAMA